MSYIAGSLLFCNAAEVYALDMIAMGDQQAGRVVVQKRQCTQCHEREPALAKTKLRAPTFQEMAKTPERYSVDSIKMFLQDPTHPMKSIVLSDREIDDIIAYIRSLKQ
jgi:mono/diheme cytochrome c family protein